MNKIIAAGLLGLGMSVSGLAFAEPVKIGMITTLSGGGAGLGIVTESDGSVLGERQSTRRLEHRGIHRGIAAVDGYGSLVIDGDGEIPHQRTVFSSVTVCSESIASRSAWPSEPSGASSLSSVDPSPVSVGSWGTDSSTEGDSGGVGVSDAPSAGLVGGS